MSIKRYLYGTVTFHYSSWDTWKYIGINRYWSGRLIYFHLGRFSMQLDCRLSWIDDVVTGDVK